MKGCPSTISKSLCWVILACNSRLWIKSLVLFNIISWWYQKYQILNVRWIHALKRRWLTFFIYKAFRPICRSYSTFDILNITLKPMLIFFIENVQNFCSNFFDITEFESRTQFSLNKPMKSMMRDLLWLLWIKCTL